MSIVISEVQDFNKIAGLAKIIWTEHYTPIIGSAQVDYMIENFQSAEVMQNQCQTQGYYYYEALADGVLAGYCAVQPEENGGLFLSKIYVEKSFRGQGIAKEFMRFILEEYKDNLKYIWLTVNKYNTNSIEAYKKMGFEVIEEIVTDIGDGFVMDDYKMRLTVL